MPVYELINPSDAYTFEAPNLVVAGAAVCCLSTSFGAKRVDGPDENTPIMFGWPEWLKQCGVTPKWWATHRTEVADALASFLIGSPADRADVVDMLAELPPEKREAWRARRQERHRTSMNQIGEQAYATAEALRRVSAKLGPNREADVLR
jgi:hypothetical protein